MKSRYSKYKDSGGSANQEKTLLMLYEGAMKFIKQAMEAADNKDVAKRGECIGRAYDIIMELTSSLNFEIGGDMAKNLEQLYIYCMEELTRESDRRQKEFRELSKGFETFFTMDGVRLSKQSKKKECKV